VLAQDGPTAIRGFEGKDSWMATPLSQLAELVSGRLCGDPTAEISDAAILSVAGPGQITLADSAERSSGLAQSSASAAVVSPELECDSMPTIVVDNVHEAFAKIVQHFRPRRSQERPGLSAQAIISKTAQLASGVDVHPLAVIGDDVVIGTGSTIHSGARIMAGCVIGRDVTVFPNVVLYEETRVGDRSIIHAGAVIGAYGFGYSQHEGRHELSSQLGYTEIGNDVEIGACTTIDRGTYGPTSIGEGTKLDNLVMIGHNCRLGKHNLICSQVGIAGSTTTGDQVVMAGQVGVRDNVHIGTGAVLCSKAGIPNDVGDGQVMLGAPATPIREQKIQMITISKLPEMRRQFRAMQRQFAEIVEQMEVSPPSKTEEQAA
jgi:UDP-3-O-[3-hydroxymyristoyl] glucosamine N-acyltransferase